MLSLIAKIGANVSGFLRGMDEIKGAAKKTGDQIASNFGNNLKNSIFGGLTVGAAAGLGKRLLDDAGRINDLAEQYGLAVAEVQALTAAAEDSGIEFERIGGAIDRLGSARKDAATKNEALRKEFERFGVTLQDLQNPAKTNLDLLKQIGAALQEIEITPATREALGEILGEKGQRLLEFIKGINDIKPLALVTPEQLELLDKFGDRLAGIARQVKELAQAQAADAIGSADKSLARVAFESGALNPQLFLATQLGKMLGFGAPMQKTAALTAEDVATAKAALEPGGPLFKKEEDASKKAKAVSGISTIGYGAPPPAGGLASAGLFFGGAGSMLYRETKTQTEIQRQSLQELRRLQSVIREEL